MLKASIAALGFVLLLATAALTSIMVPHYRDLTIRTHHEIGDFASSLDVLYLKGAHERTETLVQSLAAANTSHVGINLCDQKQSIVLNPAARTYVRFPVQDLAERMKRARSAAPTAQPGANVNVIISSVDTGERKAFGSYTARHIKTTTEVYPQPGASTPASSEEMDGWYIDLPGLGCQDASSPVGFVSVGVLLGNFPAPNDRLHIIRTGNLPHGYALEQTTRRTEDGRTTEDKIVLLQFSEAPVDPSLFEIPPGYSPALRNLHGGYDMTKPDTLANRLAQLWAEVKSSAQQMFHNSN
jgi:hypothetical protein